jgi:hypothetical protein
MHPATSTPRQLPVASFSAPIIPGTMSSAVKPGLNSLTRRFAPVLAQVNAQWPFLRRLSKAFLAAPISSGLSMRHLTRSLPDRPRISISPPGQCLFPEAVPASTKGLALICGRRFIGEPVLRLRTRT